MAIARGMEQAKLKLIERFFPDASEVTVETLEILMDLDQMSTLLSSMEDVRKGRLVSARDAFADL